LIKVRVVLGLEVLTYNNVSNDSSNRLFIHCLLLWW